MNKAILKKKILIVEDDPFISQMYKDKLRKEGYNVSIAQSGKEGLDFLKENKPDLILLDIVMPEMNGFEMLELAKKDKEIKNIPIILLTNLGQKEDIEKGLKLGADAYLIKAHFTPSEVIEKLEEIEKKIKNNNK